MSKVTGLENFKSLNKAIESRVIKKMSGTIQNTAALIFNEAKRLAPVDTGIMRSTGRIVKILSQTGPRIEVQFGGGAAKAYTIRQHEDITLRHKSGKSAKFLEIPAQTIGKMLPGIVAKDIKGEL